MGGIAPPPRVQRCRRLVAGTLLALLQEELAPSQLPQMEVGLDLNLVRSPQEWLPKNGCCFCFMDFMW